MSVIAVEEIEILYDEADKMPTRTDLIRYKEGHVFDEDKSVKWNKEEVARRNNLYLEDDNRVKQERRDAFNKANERAISYVMQETGLNRDKASAILNYVWERYHSYLHDIWCELDELIILVNRIRKED